MDNNELNTYFADLDEPYVFGPWRLVGRLRPDRVATCYLAKALEGGGVTDVQSGRVLLRVLRQHLAEEPQFVEEFLAEGRLGVGLGPSAPVPVYAVGIVDDLPYWAVDLVAGVRWALRAKRRSLQRRPGNWLPTGPAREAACERS